MKNNKNTLAVFIATVLLPLAIGAAIYRFLRITRPAILGNGAAIHLPIPSVILQSAPSLLWSFALTSALLLIWKPQRLAAQIGIAGATVVVSILFELWQAADIGQGTFDWYDCLFSIIGCGVSAFFLKRFI